MKKLISFKNIINTSTVLVIFLLGIWYFCLRILGTHLEYIPGDKGDSRFVNYLLEHGYCWLTGKTDSFWNADFMFPFHNTIALSDTMIGTQLFYFPARLLGFSPETSYQIWWLIICSLNFWSAYWVSNKIFKNHLLAAILAWTFAFSIFNLGQLNYMQMIIRFPVPIALYAAYRFADAISIKYLTIYSMAIVFQFYCVPYTGFHLLYFSLLFIVTYLLLSKNSKKMVGSYFNKSNIIKVVLVLICATALLVIFLAPYYSMSKIVGLRLYQEVIPNLPQLKSYFLPHESSIPWNFLFKFTITGQEKWWLLHLFPGIILLSVLFLSPAYLIYSRLKKIEIPVFLKSLIIATIIISVLHIRIGDNITLYALIFKLPGINSMRVLNRFMNVELFLLLLILGFAISKYSKQILVLLFMLLVIDNSFNATKVIRESKAELIKRKENLVLEIKKQNLTNKKIVALVDTLNPTYISHIDMMLAAQAIDIKTINGYSSYCPDAYGEFFLHCSENGLNKWLQNQRINSEQILIIRPHK